MRARGPPCIGMAWRTLVWCMYAFRVCVRERGPRRKMEKEEKRHITQIRGDDEARRASSPCSSSPPTFSYISAVTLKRANTVVSFRSLTIALSSALLSLYFHYSLFREAFPKYPVPGLSREVRSSASPFSTIFPRRREGVPSVCIRRNHAKPRRDIRALQDWIVKVDINSRIFPDVVLFSLLTVPHCTEICARRK